MSLQEIIKPDGVLCNATARSKKHCLEILSELLTRNHEALNSNDVFECLVERERLGCTSLNRGAAFPHCRSSGVDGSAAVLIGGPSGTMIARDTFDRKPFIVPEATWILSHHLLIFRLCHFAVNLGDFAHQATN